MSEPFSLVVQCPITPDGLGRWLAASEPGMLGWSDWDQLEIYRLSQLEELDAVTRVSGAEVMQELRERAEAPADWLFDYDRQAATLTIGQCLFTDEGQALLTYLTVLRRLGKYMDPGMEPGTIWIYDWVFASEGTKAVVSLVPGGSAIVAPEQSDAEVEAIFDRVLSPVRQAIEDRADQPIRDDLDEVIARS